jgi:hypothetical protein
MSYFRSRADSGQICVRAGTKSCTNKKLLNIAFDINIQSMKLEASGSFEKLGEEAG